MAALAREAEKAPDRRQAKREEHSNLAFTAKWELLDRQEALAQAEYDADNRDNDAEMISTSQYDAEEEEQEKELTASSKDPAEMLASVFNAATGADLTPAQDAQVLRDLKALEALNDPEGLRSIAIANDFCLPNQSA